MKYNSQRAIYSVNSILSKNLALFVEIQVRKILNMGIQGLYVRRQVGDAFDERWRHTWHAIRCTNSRMFWYVKKLKFGIFQIKKKKKQLPNTHKNSPFQLLSALLIMCNQMINCNNWNGEFLYAFGFFKNLIFCFLTFFPHNISTNHLQQYGTFKIEKMRQGVCSRNLP